MPGINHTVKILIISLIFLCGCASSWDKQRKQVKRDYRQNKISDDTYESLMHRLDRDERIYLQQSKDDKALKQQAKQRKEDGFFVPTKEKNCTSACDYYGNCQTVCD